MRLPTSQISPTCRSRTLPPPRASDGNLRVPAVYLGSAILALVSVLELRGMNNLRICSGPDGSIPTAGTNVFNELPYFLRNITLCRLHLGCGKLRTCRTVQLIDARHIRIWVKDFALRKLSRYLCVPHLSSSWHGVRESRTSY